ncbi:MAG TPA: DUF134 domain-containing protein [Selenomonadales bacterium]|nr:DUF134 domain-containing protein [Selenomonadales bacterium]
MARRRCCGLIDDEPPCRMFVPRGETGKEAVRLLFEEYEAVRLKDRLGLEQAEGAAVMGLSRPTFQRILQSARTKLAEALVEGRAILIEGGNYVMKNRVFECAECAHVWEVEPCSAGGKHGYEIACPECGSLKKLKIENGVKRACGHQPGDSHSHGHGCCGGH